MNEFFKITISLLPVFFPIICGAIVTVRQKSPDPKYSFSKPMMISFFVTETILTCLFVAFGSDRFVLFRITDNIRIVFGKDILSSVFSCMVSVIFLIAGIYAVDYIRHDDMTVEEEQKVRTLSGRVFLGFYFIVWGVLIGLAEAQNLITFYMFYEIMTVTSVVLVLHEMTKEAIYAAKKYLYYSIAGASAALFGFAFIYNAAKGSLEFVPGGAVSEAVMSENSTLILISVFLMIIGFGTKAGMFPMHGWLPTAHPAAPAPASAVLSGIICKAGVLGIARVIFYLVGAGNIRGTWVQYTFLSLSLITVFMGSMLAYKESVMKKRFAYSTVSQVSYVLFGIACLNWTSLFGALLHAIFHSVLKTTLFLTAGTVIYSTDRHECKELVGIGKAMPLTMIAFSVASLGLIGIPPVCGFVSKWYLCEGALGQGAFGYVGVGILLISAILTAGYLFSIVIVAFFPGEEFEGFDENLEKNGKITKGMITCIMILAVLAVLLGVFAYYIADISIDGIKALF